MYFLQLWNVQIFLLAWCPVSHRSLGCFDLRRMCERWNITSFQATWCMKKYYVIFETPWFMYIEACIFLPPGEGMTGNTSPRASRSNGTLQSIGLSWVKLVQISTRMTHELTMRWFWKMCWNFNFYSRGNDPIWLSIVSHFIGKNDTSRFHTGLPRCAPYLQFWRLAKCCRCPLLNPKQTTKKHVAWSSRFCMKTSLFPSANLNFHFAHRKWMGSNLPNFLAAGNLEIESFFEPPFLFERRSKNSFVFRVFNIEVGCDDKVENIRVKFGLEKKH